MYSPSDYLLEKKVLRKHTKEKPDEEGRAAAGQEPMVSVKLNLSGEISFNYRHALDSGRKKMKCKSALALNLMLNFLSLCVSTSEFKSCFYMEPIKHQLDYNVKLQELHLY